jgi:hypothetical protein
LTDDERKVGGGIGSQRSDAEKARLKRMADKAPAFRLRRISRMGIDAFHEEAAGYARARRIRQGAVPAAVRMKREAEETRHALNCEKGHRAKAAIALGITTAGLYARISALGLGEWLATAWPAHENRTSEVMDVWYDDRGPVRMRVYQVRCGTEIHVKRVPAVGVERKRVVCEVCKEARTK